jgi:hypothetical protein
MHFSKSNFSGATEAHDPEKQPAFTASFRSVRFFPAGRAVPYSSLPAFHDKV